MPIANQPTASPTTTLPTPPPLPLGSDPPAASVPTLVPTTTQPCTETLDDHTGTAETPATNVPTQLAERVDRWLTDPRFNELDVSFSVAFEGYANPIDHHANLALLPASNQKLVTAIGVAELLDLDERFVTKVQRIGPDLHLVASGDPTLTSDSLDELARSVAGSDIEEVRTLFVVAPYTSGSAAPGWQDWQLPTYVGPLSALMVDDNRYRTDADFVANPALENGELFADMLRSYALPVNAVTLWDLLDDTRPGTAEELARVESPTFGELAATMLLSSDNQNADQLANEIGFRFGLGSIADGTARIAEALDEWCLDLSGTSGDGSGLSRDNWRSASEFRRLLAQAQRKPWFTWFKESLPIAGQTGTLAARFNGTDAEGRIHAKTGSIIGGKALSGYGTSVGGRAFTFSLIINGAPDRVVDAQPAMDSLITELAAHRS